MSWRTAAGPSAAAAVVHHDGLFLVLFQRVGGLEDLIAGHLPRAREVAERKLLLRTQVKQQHALVHEPDQLLRGHRDETFRARAYLVYNNERGDYGGGGGEPWVVAQVFEETVHEGGWHAGGEKGRAL